MVAGAAGLGSHKSMWLGEPCRYSRITPLARPKPDRPDPVGDFEASRASDCLEKTVGRLRPTMLSPPTVISSLRESASQSLPRLVRIESMLSASGSGVLEAQDDGLILAADLETKPFV